MPLDIYQDLDAYIPDAECADRGDYRVRIRDCRETENHSLMVSGEITFGKKQKNGKDPVGRDYTFFVSLHPEEIENEWFRKRSLNLLKKFFLACGADSSAEATDFIEKEIWVVNGNRKDKETGRLRDDPQDFRPYAG